MNVSEQSKFCEISLSFRCVKCYGFHIWHVNIWVEIFYNVSLPWIQNLIDIPNASKKICLSFTRVLNNSYFNETLVSGLIFLVSFEVMACTLFSAQDIFWLTVVLCHVRYLIFQIFLSCYKLKSFLPDDKSFSCTGLLSLLLFHVAPYFDYLFRKVISLWQLYFQVKSVKEVLHTK